MSQMSIEEEKVPGDFARLAARGEPEVADQQDAPADDAFVRRAAPRAARRAAQPKPVSDEDLLSGMNDDPEQLAITKANAQQRQEEFWRGVGGGAQGTSRSAPTGDAQGRMGVAGPRSLDLWQEGDPEPAIPGPVAGNARAAAPRSLAQTIQDRKFEASLSRPAEPDQQAPVLGKAGSRSKFLDNASGVLDWAAKGVGLVKEADDTATLYGKDIPDVMEATGEQFGGTREAMDSALAGYSPFQSAVQGVGGWTDAANKALNPIPKVSLGKVGGKDIKLGVGTKEILSAASGVMQIAQFHKNEDADPNATAMPERAAVATGQTEFRRALEARRRAGRLFEKAGGYQDAGGVGMSPAHTEDGRVQKLLLDEKKRANLVAMKKGMRLALRAHDLGKAQEKSGVRSLNEYSMEKTAYLNDKEFVPRKPLGFSDKSDADKWSPKKGMIKDGEVAKAADYIEASKTVHDRYAEQGAVKGQDLPAGLMPGMQDSAKLEALDDGYRDDIEGGRSKQKQVAPARFLGGAGQLFEGTLNSKRMVRDGRYKTAYAAKAAELGVLTGTKTGAAAAQAGLIAATGGVAAPLIAAAEAGKHLAFHAKEQLGVGMQSASEGLEKLIDPTGLAKEQDNRDLYNKHFGLQKPEAAPDVAEAPANDAPGNDAVGANVASSDVSEEKQPAPLHPFFSQAPEPQPMGAPYDEVQQIMSKKHEYFGMSPEEFQAVQAQRGAPVETAEAQPAVQSEQEAEVPQKSAAPSYEEITADPSARAADVRQRGLIFEPQGSSAVVGRQKRTVARAAKDLLWGGTKKVAKGLWSGLKGIATVPIHAAKWGWKGVKGIGSLFSRKKKAAPENSARTALKALQEHSKMGDLDRPQFDFSSISQADVGLMSKEEQDQLRLQRAKYEEVFGSKAHAKADRVGGTRQAAKEALMAKPEVKRAEERAVLREQLAPGKYTPRMGSGELLDILRGRARADLEAEDKRPGHGGDGGNGGHGGDGGDGGGGSGDLLDQINALEGSGGVRPDRVAGSVSSEQPVVMNNRKFKNALVDESDSSGEKMPAEPEKQAQEPGAAPTGGQQGAQEVRAKRQDSYGQRVEEWQAKADAAGMGLIMDPEDPWLQANPFPADRPNLPHFDEKEDYDLPVDAGGGPAKAMESQGQKPVSVAKAPSSGQGPVMKQLIGGEWQEQPEEEKGAGPVLQGSAKGSDEAAFQPFWKGTRHHYGPGPDDYFEYDESVFKPKGVAREDAGAGSPPVKAQDPPRHEPLKDAPPLQKKDESPARTSVHDGAWLRQQRKSAERREASLRAQARKDAAGRSIPKTADRLAFPSRPSMSRNGALESSGRREYPFGENEVPIADQDEASTSERLRGANPRRPSNAKALFDKALPLQGRRLDDLTEEERAVGIAAMDVDRMRQQALSILDQDSRTGAPLADIAEADREEDVELPADLNTPWQVPGPAPRRPAKSDALAGLQLPPPPKKPGFLASSKTRARYGQEQLARSRQVEAMKSDALAQQERQHSAALDAHRSGVDAYESRKKGSRDAITETFDQAVADRDVTAPEAVRKSAFGGLMWETLSQVYVRDHMPDLLSGGGRLPETVAAEQRVAEAVEKEDASSRPFSSSAGGRHAGVLDATHDLSQGGKAVPRLAGASAAGGAGVGNMLFGAPRAQGPQLSTAAQEDLTTLMSNMDASHAAERARMHQAGQQVRADQGDLAMPMPGLRPGAEMFRAPFFNAYWNREIQQPNPTRQATHSRKVRFDDSVDQQVPMDQRPPDRPFAVRQQHDHAKKLKKRSALRAAGEQAKMHAPDVWAGMEAAGEFVHEREKKRVFPGPPPPVLQQPPPQHQAPQQPPASVHGAQLANEEEKVNSARPLPGANTGRAGEVGDGAANLPSARKIDDLFRRGRSPVVPYDDAAFANRVTPAYDVYDDEPAKYQADLRAEGFQDVSTRHEDLDLPSAYVHVPEESEDLPDWVSSFSGPGGELDIADSPEGATSGGYQALSANDVHEKRQARAARRAALPSNYLDDKRVLDTAGSLTPDALGHGGPITVDGREVYPQYPNRDRDADRPFGGHWRHADTGQRVQDATVHGARDNPPYAEFHGPAIPAERVLQVPAPGWDAQPKKPGLLSGKGAKESYARAKQARAGVVRSAFDAYQRKELERPPGYIGDSEYAKNEWRRLDAVAAEEKQRALMRQRGVSLF